MAHGPRTDRSPDRQKLFSDPILTQGTDRGRGSDSDRERGSPATAPGRRQTRAIPRVDERRSFGRRPPPARARGAVHPAAKPLDAWMDSFRSPACFWRGVASGLSRALGACGRRRAPARPPAPGEKSEVSSRGPTANRPRALLSRSRLVRTYDVVALGPTAKSIAVEKRKAPANGIGLGNWVASTRVLVGG